jgi:hypothetical protein
MFVRILGNFPSMGLSFPYVLSEFSQFFGIVYNTLGCYCSLGWNQNLGWNQSLGLIRNLGSIQSPDWTQCLGWQAES